MFSVAPRGAMPFVTSPSMTRAQQSHPSPSSSSSFTPSVVHPTPNASYTEPDSQQQTVTLKKHDLLHKDVTWRTFLRAVFRSKENSPDPSSQTSNTIKVKDNNVIISKALLKAPEVMVSTTSQDNSGSSSHHNRRKHSDTDFLTAGRVGGRPTTSTAASTSSQQHRRGCLWSSAGPTTTSNSALASCSSSTSYSVLSKSMRPRSNTLNSALPSRRNRLESISETDEVQPPQARNASTHLRSTSLTKIVNKRLKRHSLQMHCTQCAEPITTSRDKSD